MNRYIVFERPEGSKCWTIAHRNAVHLQKQSYMPMQFGKLALAAKAALEVQQWHIGANNKPMEAHIATIELPE